MTLPTLPAPKTAVSGLLEGLGMGVQQVIPSIQEMIMSKQQADQKQRQIQSILGMGQQQQAAPELGGEGSQAPRGLDLTPEKVFALSQVDPSLGNMASNLYAAQEKERVGTEKEFLKTNLGSFKESQGKLPELKNTDLRLNRLDTLSKSGKLPGPLFAKLNIGEGGKVRFPALFSKEGQEFVKLITDSAKGAKDSFGARVTNFELDTFLQSLPSLLQSGEGREAVIRDLKIMNEMNRIHHQAVIDTSKQTGFKVDPAQFEAMVQQKIGPQIEQLSSQFVSPENIQKPRKELKSIFGGK